jgi:hypothetical protein
MELRLIHSICVCDAFHVGGTWNKKATWENDAHPREQEDCTFQVEKQWREDKATDYE